MTRGRPFQKGVSGNPRGRPSGTAKVAKLRDQIARQVPEILNGLIQSALNGDVQAARLLIERVLPPVKATEQPVPIELPPGTLTERAEAVLSAIGEGELAPSQGAALLSALGNVAKATEIDELARRIAALEEKHANP